MKVKGKTYFVRVDPLSKYMQKAWHREGMNWVAREIIPHTVRRDAKTFFFKEKPKLYEGISGGGVFDVREMRERGMTKGPAGYP